MAELVVKLPRRPGEKEARFAHLLSGPPVLPEEEAAAPTPAMPDRIGTIEAEITQLRNELEDLRQQFAGFRKQFE